jgi:hypothetical protein
VFRENQASDENSKSLRVSIDTKAKVKIGNLTLELEQYQPQWQRSETLPKWDITIVPV